MSIVQYLALPLVKVSKMTNSNSSSFSREAFSDPVVTTEKPPKEMCVAYWCSLQFIFAFEFLFTQTVYSRSQGEDDWIKCIYSSIFHYSGVLQKKSQYNVVHCLQYPFFRHRHSWLATNIPWYAQAFSDPNNISDALAVLFAMMRIVEFGVVFKMCVCEFLNFFKFGYILDFGHYKVSGFGLWLHRGFILLY